MPTFDHLVTALSTLWTDMGLLTDVQVDAA
jgi:hypothetical protein